MHHRLGMARLPGDELVEIAPVQHAELFAQLYCTGRPLGADAQGYTVLLDVPLLSDEQRAVIERQWRDHHLASPDALVARHRDEVEAGLTTSLSAEQYATLRRGALSCEDGQTPWTSRRVNVGL
jgi:hypothetical protein